MSITISALKNVLVTFLSDPWVYQFCLIQAKITNKISYVETGKKCGKLYLLCKKLQSNYVKAANNYGTDQTFGTNRLICDFLVCIGLMQVVP